MGQDLVRNVASIDGGGREHEFGSQDTDFDEDYYGRTNESDDLRPAIY